APLMRHLRYPFLILDAIGLIAFTLIGCQTALDMGHGLLIASLSGVVTGVFGGVLRDIFCNDIPLVFRRELYAGVAFVASWFYFACDYLGLLHKQAILLTFAVGFAFRLMAILFHWEMPKFQYKDER
ncbi:trimeric intracellular cation channel family protein, partial [Pseudomonas sihuiensis]